MLYGFFGLTERYEESIEMFNALYGTEISHKHMNSKTEGSLNIEDVDPKVLERIKKINAKDMELYNNVKNRFTIRQKLFEKNLPYTYSIIQKIDKNQISGIAFQKESDDSVEVDIYSDEKYLTTVAAKTMRAGQIRYSVPRRGYVGFDYVYKGDGVLNGKLRAVVKATGQEIV